MRAPADPAGALLRYAGLMTAQQPRTALPLPDGTEGGAAAPAIVSASRVTDIPAFHARWLMARLRAGWCARRNPYSGRISYISFENCRAIVFWTKDPSRLMPMLGEIASMGCNFYFLFTLNSYEGTGLEPCVRSFKARAEAFRKLAKMLGPSRVIWRFDPLILAPGLGVADLIGRVREAGEAIFGCSERLIVSFADIRGYSRVRRNLAEGGIFKDAEDALAGEFSRAQMLEAAAGLARLRDGWKASGWDLEITTCAEDIGLEEFGITHGACIDAALMQRLWPHDERLMHYLRTGKVLKDGMRPLPIPATPPDLKDPSQRKACRCAASRDIGSGGTCPHLCAYCYANPSRQAVMSSLKIASQDSPAL